MAVEKVTSTRVINPYAMYVTPYDGEEKGGTIYKLDEVIRDTTTITQEDPTENRIENEFSSAPIVNSVKLGAYTFSAEVANMHPALLEALCGYTAGENKAYAPETYKDRFAEIALVFSNGQKEGEDKYIAAILPKVQLNSKATLDSLSTSMGRITLAGTGLNASVDNHNTPFVLDLDYTLPAETTD